MVSGNHLFTSKLMRVITKQDVVYATLYGQLAQNLTSTVPQEGTNSTLSMYHKSKREILQSLLKFNITLTNYSQQSFSINN